MNNHHCPSCNRPMEITTAKAHISEVGFCSVECRIQWWQRHDRRTVSVKVTFNRRKT